jgi:SSS family solute:Na+ symporter
LYFVTVFGVAGWATISERRQQTSSADYFLAGRNVGWFVIGASLFASNIGSEHLVGLAGTGAASGVAVGQFEILASLILLVLGWVFVPFYLRSGVFTMPEFLERRYSPAARWYLAVISIVGYVLTKISVTIAATGIYTVLGGLRAVLYTDLLQMFVLVGGAVAVTFIGLGELGGWGAMVEEAGPGFMSVWKPLSDPDFPWTGILLGAPILGVWYWCTDQFIVQRVLSAVDEDNARRGTIFGGLLKLLPLFIFVVPGVVAHALAARGQITLDSPDQALPTLIGALLPLGIRGLVVAGLLAALMSSLSSVFNSCSTLFTRDIYLKLRPDASEVRQVRVGQTATVVLVALGLLWIPMMQFISGQLYQYLQSVQAYISPPIAAVFLIGILWRRANAAGAIAALATGFVFGTLRLVAELTKEEQAGFTLAYAEINFLHFAALLFVVCSAVLVGVSLLTRAPDADKLDGLTFTTTAPSEEGPPSRWRMQDRWASVLVLLLVGLVWLYFSPWVQAR